MNLAANIPQGHIDAGERTGLDRAAAPIGMAVHALPDPLDPFGIGTQDELLEIPNGAAGIENRFGLMWTYGVLTGKIDVHKFVDLFATQPAKIFGLYPRKGTLAVGSDADVVVFDPEKRVTISASTHHSRSDYNLYEGTQVEGSPDVVLLRGNVIVEGDELLAKPGSGQFIRRAKFGEELKPAALQAA